MVPSRFSPCVQPFFRVLCVLSALSIGLSMSQAEPDVTVPPLPAFPGAEGFGAYTPGGRGGRVIEVTNLNGEGPGSLRAAVEAEGPRIIVFRVAGIIDNRKGLVVRNPYVTIAGQSAPGDGICLAHGPLTISTHDVIVRHIRVRTGDHPAGPSPENRDALEIGGREGVHDVIVDQCSFSWALDETANTWYGPRNITIQWSIISEGLRDNTNPFGPTGMGLLLGSGENTVSVHHNLLAHHHQRNPMISGTPGKDAAPSVIDFRNNVIYSHRRWPDAHLRDAIWLNYVGNTVLIGGTPEKPIRPSDTPFRTGGNTTAQRFYLRDNVWPGKTGTYALNEPEPFPVPPVTTQPQAEAYEVVLRYAGATLPVRDVVDARVIEEVRTGTGGRINTQAEVGGWPDYRFSEPPPDSDHDGMPDAWELRFGFDPHDPSNGPADADGDGYTNVEEYLNGTDPTVKTDAHGEQVRVDPEVQSGNDALRFGVARRIPEPPVYRPEEREEFLAAVRKSGQEVADFVGMTFVRVDPGSFEVQPPEGARTPAVRVTLTKPYQIDRYEVTQAQWEQVMGTKPWLNQPFAADVAGHPATYVSYDDVQEFLERLNAAGRHTYRLPTEAEWEWAWLSGEPAPDEATVARTTWHFENTVLAGNAHPQPVGLMPANTRGLHDMAGNVGEWCQDKWDYWTWRRGGEKVDPTGATNETWTEGYYVVRGGNIHYRPRQLLRFPGTVHRPGYRNFDVGFRVVREVDR